LRLRGGVRARRHFLCGKLLTAVLIAKSVCDFGDVEKDDQYQRYAAHTSAAFVRDLFENGQMF